MALLKKGKFYRLFDYLLMLLAVFQCNTIYMTTSPFHLSKFDIVALFQILLFILFLVVIPRTINRNVTSLLEFYIIFTFLVLILILYNIIFLDSFSGEFYTFQMFSDCIFFITYFYTLKNIDDLSYLFIIFEKIVVILSYISLLCWILMMLHIPTNMTIMSSWGAPVGEVRPYPGYFGVSYFSKYSGSFFGLNIVRNQGIFAEPSMFAYVALFALLIELFMRHHKKLFNNRIIVLLLVIISTASTTGVLVSIPAIIFYIALSSNIHHLGAIISILLLPILFIIIKAILFNKIGNNSSNASSFSIRMSDINAGCRTWIQHPLFGCGLGRLSDIVNNVSSSRIIDTSTTHFSDSSGFSMLIAQGGVFTLLFYLLSPILASRINAKYMGLAIFSFIPFWFVTAQSFFIYIMLLSYFWATVLGRFNKFNEDYKI